METKSYCFCFLIYITIICHAHLLFPIILSPIPVLPSLTMFLYQQNFLDFIGSTPNLI